MSPLLELVDMRYGRVLRAVAFRMMRSQQDAEDLYGDMPFLIQRGIRTWQPTGSFRNWLIQLQRNACRSELRRRRSRQFVSLDEMTSPSGESEQRREIAAADDTEREALGSLDREAIDVVLRALSPKSAEIVRRRFLLDHTPAQIALDMGLTVNNVNVTVHQALRRLRLLLPREVL